MSRYTVTGHNDEFRELYYEDSGMTKEQVAALLGVSLHAVQSWLKPATSKSSNACAKGYVDALRFAIDAPEGKESEAVLERFRELSSKPPADLAIQILFG